MKKTYLFTLLLLSLLLAACSGGKATVAPTEEPVAEPTAVEVVEAETNDFQPRYEPLPPDECFVSPPEGVEITVDYDCGYVVVPEFYQGESTRVLKVPFLRFNSPQDTDASPVLFHPGGPGQSHINGQAFSVFSTMFSDVIAERDVIYMDPRGTELADPFLDCPAFYSLNWQAYQQGLDQEAAEVLVTETVQKCMDDFKAQGVNFDAYNSLELAGDVNSVRQALGYEQIIYFGTSYGSILGQHLMRDYPDILEAVILNGSSPLSRKSWIEDRALNSQVAFDNLVTLCLADEKCNAAYPDIPGLLDAARAHFKDGPLPYTYADPNDPSLTIEGEVDASSLAQFIFSLQGSQYAVFAIPSVLNRLAPPDQKEATAAFLGETFASGLIASRDQTRGEEALLMHLAVVCSDDTVKSEDEIILDGASEFAIDVARAEAATYVKFCPLLNVAELPEGTDENVTADIPTLLLSGGLDVATPPVHSQLIADALPNATHVIFPTHTHDQVGGFYQCVKNVFTQFIADPSAALDTSCAEDPDPKYTGFTLPDGSTSLADTEEPETVADSLWSHSWQWVSFTNPVEQYDIDTPADYVLTFYEDGALTIVADCNTVLGEYTDDAGALTITPGPSTLVACPPESRSDQFVQLLEGVARYFFEDGNLYIDLMADGGTLKFAPVNLEGLVDEDAIGSNMPEDLVAQLDAFLQSQVYSDGGDPELAAPGLVLLVDTPAGRYLNATGVANLEDGTPMQIDDILEIGSNTKSMTVVVLMQLVEEGVLTLDDTLDQWLPEQAALFPNGDQMTLRQLAQHTAGLWDYGNGIIGSGVSDPDLLEASYTPDELIQYAAENGTPYFAPGAEGKWQYSNTGYILLGMILEKASGQSLTELYQTRIFDPLGMESAVLIEGVPQPGEITTHGYYWSEETGESVDTTNWNASQGWAAGAVAMSAADLATYAHRLAMGDLFQNPETLVEMLSFNASARLGVGAPYGLGLLDVAGDGTAWGHGGQTLGFQSLWFTDPADGIVVVGLTNSASYSANNLLNVRNILQGEGAQPLGPLTLLPLGELISTSWAWTQFVNPAESVAIEAEAGLVIDLAKDQSVTVNSAACGEAYGAYTTDGTGQISFDLDDSGMTCDANSLAGQFVQHLKDATRWHFDNGSLVIELPADGGSMLFSYLPPE